MHIYAAVIFPRLPIRLPLLTASFVACAVQSNFSGVWHLVNVQSVVCANAPGWMTCSYLNPCESAAQILSCGVSACEDTPSSTFPSQPMHSTVLTFSPFSAPAQLQ